MSGFANSSHFPALLALAAVIGTISGTITLVIGRLCPSAGKAVVAIGSALVVPVLILVLGFAAFLLIPAGNSPDGPGMLLVGTTSLAIAAMPISLLAGLAIVAIRKW